MKPETSPLRIIDFAITKLDFEMIFTPEPDGDMISIFQSYPLEIDFDLERDGYLRTFIKAEINKNKEIAGYSISAEAVCIFEFDNKEDLPGDVKRSMEGFSTIYIALNSLRGLISSFTANAPFGRYILPSIDLNDLIEKKKAAAVSEGVSKKGATKKTAVRNAARKKTKTMNKR
jgi:hypothetical protein